MMMMMMIIIIIINFKRVRRSGNYIYHPLNLADCTFSTISVFVFRLIVRINIFLHF